MKASSEEDFSAAAVPNSNPDTSAGVITDAPFTAAGGVGARGTDQPVLRLHSFKGRLGSSKKTPVAIEIREFERKFHERREDGLREETRLRKAANFATKSHYYSLASLILVNISVFGTEVGVLVIPKEYDWAVQVLLVVALLFFTMDTLLLCYIRDDYFGSPTFWLDLVSIISLLPDIAFISAILATALSLPTGGDRAVAISRFAATAARTGSRVSKSLRFIRMFRIIRLARLVRLFTFMSKKKQTAGNVNTGHSFGDRLAESSLHKVIVTVMAVMLIFPLLESSDELANPYESYGLKQLIRAYDHFGFESAPFAVAFQQYTDYENSLDILYLQIAGNTFIQDTETIESLRSTDIFVISEADSDSEVYFNLQEIGQEEAMFSILKACLLVSFLGILSVSFSRQIRAEVSEPLQRLIQAMSALSIGQSARNYAKMQGKRHEVTRSVRKRSLHGFYYRNKTSTGILHTTVNSLTSILHSVETFLSELIPPEILLRIRKGEEGLLSNYKHAAVLVCRLCHIQEITELETSVCKEVLVRFATVIEKEAREMDDIHISSCNGLEYALVAGCPKANASPVKKLLDLGFRLQNRFKNSIIEVRMGIDAGPVQAGLFSETLRFHVFGKTVDSAKAVCMFAPEPQIFVSEDAIKRLTPGQKEELDMGAGRDIKVIDADGRITITICRKVYATAPIDDD